MQAGLEVIGTNIAQVTNATSSTRHHHMMHHVSMPANTLTKVDITAALHIASLVDVYEAHMAIADALHPRLHACTPGPRNAAFAQDMLQHIFEDRNLRRIRPGWPIVSQVE
jgi:hypothetical protein